ncbi:Imm26 family immunity protein [Chitinivorax sp. PXF-14]|uniref:Imm26 family immunity protein n=1 Tax=Chitinivorax sp. PXF-14 TaxID=3230488 RepID=UPI0034672824
MKKLTINNGTVVLVPVVPAGFAIGVVIRADGKGRAVGAFFGPRVNSASDVNASELQLESAVLVCRFGDHGLHTKRWPMIGVIPSWGSAPWHVTKFSRRHDNPDLCYVTEYDESLNVISEVVLPAAEGKALPDEAQYGSGVVEAKLAKLLQ